MSRATWCGSAWTRSAGVAVPCPRASPRWARPSPVPLNGPWTVSFTPGWGAPAQATFDKLLSWSEHPDPGIRYYSGTARYTTRVDLPTVREWTLDLGDVREIAEVWLNGQPLGILW